MIRVLHALALALLAGFAFSCAAQTYPVKPVRVIIVFPPGGSNDVTARIVFSKMAEITGQQFVLENRGGAAGTIGSEFVARSAPDGYTIMIQSTTHVANAHLYNKLAYDPLKDFIGVTTLARQVGVLLVHPSLPVRSGRELLALAKRRPGDITFASSGNGSYAHMAMALFLSMAKINMIHVPYKGGGPANVALVAGETQTLLTTLGSVLPYIQQGRARALGVSSPARSTLFPDIPAIAEFVPGYDFVGWVGCFVPAGTPGNVVNALNTILKKALDDPEIGSKLRAQTLDPLHATPEQFARRLQEDYDKYGVVVKASGAKIE
ncbi:MAG: Bug family tripartite tricarboxylate transporter substrate binding protein [Burkholderiales bacterium]